MLCLFPKTGIPPLATNRVYLLENRQFHLHRILRAMSLNTKLSRLKAMDLCRDDSLLVDAQCMADQYPHAPEAGVKYREGGGTDHARLEL